MERASLGPTLVWLSDLPLHGTWRADAMCGETFQHVQVPLPFDASHLEEPAAFVIWSDRRLTMARGQELAQSFQVPLFYVYEGSAISSFGELPLEPDDGVCLLPDVLCEDQEACLALLAHELRQFQERVQRRLQPVGERDSLTGLLSRRACFQQLEEAIQGLVGQQALSLMVLDIDWFKMINDQHGHLFGDRVLVELARRLEGVCSPMSILGRIGGEEFLLVQAIGRDDAMVLAEALRQVVADQPFAAPDLGVVDGVDVTISMGVTTIGTQQRTDAVAFLRAADEALYAAKARGRNQALHVAHLMEEAIQKGTRPEVELFENMTRVLTERVGDVIAYRGRRLLEEMNEQAEIDPLTGLYNRGYLNRRLAFEFETASEDASEMVVALLDIDCFGEVNKTHGWLTGDKVLTDVATRIRSNVRADDWVARYGGEELCVVMRGCPPAQAEQALERLRLAVSQEPFLTTQGKHFSLTVSIGAAFLRVDDENLDALLERVSTSLLAAKRGGKNQVAFWQEAAHS